MRSLRSLAPLALALAACVTDGTSAPLAQPPALLVTPVATLVEVLPPMHRIDMRAVGRSPQSFTYGDCSDRVLDRQTDSGWERTTVTGVGGICGLVGRTLRGVGTERTIEVHLGHRPEPGVYRVRMEFSTTDGLVTATSNAFVIE